jgi:hypothetical protein
MFTIPADILLVNDPDDGESGRDPEIPPTNICVVGHHSGVQKD